MTRIDLLAPEMLPLRARVARWSGVGILCLAGAVAVGAAWRAQTALEAALAAEVQRLEALAGRLQERREVAAAECVAAAPLAAAVGRVRGAAAGVTAMLDTLHRLSRALPEEAWIDDLALAPNQLRLAGGAVAPAAVTTLVERLRDDARLGEIELTAREEGEGAAFVVTAAR